MALAGWLVTMLAVLIWYLLGLGSSATYANERQAVFFLCVVVLTFPSGTLWILAYSYLRSLLLPAEAGVPLFAEAICVWVGSAVLGYLQWFVVLRKVIGRT